MPQEKTKFAIPRPGRPKAPADPPLPVENPDPDTGLTAAQAARRMEAGLDNREVASPTKTTWQIVRENTFTFSPWCLWCWPRCCGRWAALPTWGS